MSLPYGLFKRFGVELEYMIVARDDLRVLPVCDRLLREICGAPESEVEMGELSWSNELVLHVIEFKT
ncbi:MAG: glutamate--cysteine ligase, partial [Phycisphaerae bacterium]|nr:glutamate--cysteine ligase [Phycisphaerae bacterium]